MKKHLIRIIAMIMLTALCVGLCACNSGINITVNFYVDGEQYSQQTTKKGVAPQMPSNPSKEGYTFDAWYYDNGVWEKPMTAQSFLDLPLTEDMTVKVYAHFVSNNPQEQTHTATINFIVRGQTYKTDTTSSDKMVALPAEPKVDGYTFDAWYFDDGVWQKPFTEQTFHALSISENINISVYAHFVEVHKPEQTIQDSINLYKNRDPFYISFSTQQGSEWRKVEWYETSKTMIINMTDSKNTTSIYIDQTHPSEDGTVYYSYAIDYIAKKLIYAYGYSSATSFQNLIPEITGNGEESTYTTGGKVYSATRFTASEDIYAYFVNDDNKLLCIIFASADNQSSIKYENVTVASTIPESSILFGVDGYAKDDNSIAFTVMSDSMSPALTKGTTYYFDKVTDTSKLKVNDIVLVRTDIGGYPTLMAHRIVSIENQGENAVFKLKGDNNPVADTGEYTRESIIGVLTATQGGDQPTEPDKPVEQTVLRIGGNIQNWAGIQNIIAKFEKAYPNYRVEYEYIENYNSEIATKLNDSNYIIDIFVSTSQTLSTLGSDVYYDIKANPYSIVLPESSVGYMDNSLNGNSLYAVPYGGDVYGMYVNKTLLDQYQLIIPTNQAELLACCQELYSAGFIPLQGNTSTLANLFLYPYICNIVFNSGDNGETYRNVLSIADGVSNYFSDPYQLLYSIVESGYYDYKEAESRGFVYSDNASSAKLFLNIINGIKQDDIGQVAFLPGRLSQKSTIDGIKAEYNSKIDYVFIMSPVGIKGGYGLITPSHGFSINSKTENPEASLKFLSFFYQPDNAKAFARIENLVPNTESPLAGYGLKPSRTVISDQIYQFMNEHYNYYLIVVKLLAGGYNDGDDEFIGISKMNNPIYMEKVYTAVTNDYIFSNPEVAYYCLIQDEYIEADSNYRDAHPDDVYYTLSYKLMHTLSEYLDRLEAEFQKEKNSMQ